ncbi:MAG: tail fiber domain-containing protein, partial [Acidobacteria bacterium]|nr:tail fiber domain-containing protein [Acidobacteriota bacterium]
KFDDTSTTAGCPNNDWQLTANDACGGSNKFSIEDITGSKVPFTITAGASTNSIFVDSTGRVGFRTSTPVLDLHVNTSNTPAMRLEQNNTGGFTAQTWDVAGNEANFFVRDVTGGSRLPFRIRPGAPTSSIDINASGFVGVGTASPSEALTVIGAVKVNGTTSTVTANTTSLDYLSGGGRIVVFGASAGTPATFQMVLKSSDSTTGTTALAFDSSARLGLGGVTSPSSPIQHQNGATLSAGGVWTNASSRALKQDIRDLDTKDALSVLKDIQPVTYSYKIDPTEHHVGFIAEDVPDLVATKDRKGLSAMDVVAVLTSVVKEQQKTIDDLKARLDQIEKKQ